MFANGKETLDAGQLDQTLKKFGVKGDAKAMIAEAGAGAAIDFLAFQALMAKKMAMSDSEDDIRDAFLKFDWKKSGEINSKELSEALTNLGKPLTTREVSSHFIFFLF